MRRVQTLQKLSCPGACPLAAPGTPRPPRSTPGLTSRRVGDHRQLGPPSSQVSWAKVHTPASPIDLLVGHGCVSGPRQGQVSQAQPRTAQRSCGRRADLQSCWASSTAVALSPSSGGAPQKPTDFMLPGTTRGEPDADACLFRTPPNGHL